MNIVIGGSAGQGLVTIGELLAKSLVRSGYHVVVTQSYMSRIRGGHNTFALRVSPTPIAAPIEAIDILLAMNDDTITLHRKDLVETGIIVADETSKVDEAACLKTPYGTFGPKECQNVAALGVAGALLALDMACLADAVDGLFDKKKPEMADLNRQVLAKAYEWSSAKLLTRFRLNPAPSLSRRLTMTGNDAIALGAMSAGVRFCAFYPMTPSTSIPLSLVKHGEAAGVIVEQAEDEIAAINMAIGASFAGAPAMVATSGGGFALMVEGVSLAAMTETPLVIIIGQRPAPATGLPTRTEQSDLEFVLHAGHGEFPRAVFAPGSVEQCFHLTRHAFTLADKYQGPVFLLTDQFLADSYRAVAPFDLPADRVASPDAKEEEGLYKRFRITDTGVSPRLLPGVSRHLVVVDSDEHTEDGHITEDLDVRRHMVEKRLRKLDGLRGEVIPPQFYGDQKPDLLLVCWGSAQGAVVEAAANMSRSAQRIGVLHFSQTWPLVPAQFLKTLQTARQVVCVEGNATAQFARLLRRETGFEATGSVLRYDGLPFTPEFIVKGVEPWLNTR